METQKYLTTQELAAALNISDARICKLRIDGRLPGALEKGGTWFFPQSLASGFAKKKAGRPQK